MAACAFTLVGCVRTQTKLIKPPPCVVATWPTFPEFTALVKEDVVLIATEDADRWLDWSTQVDRIHTRMVETCPEVRFTELPTVTPDPTPGE